MNDALYAQVWKIAEWVRDWAEELARKRNDVPTLSGLCAIASAELYKELAGESIPAEIHMADDGNGSCHVYVLVDDHVVDVTATQFKEYRQEPVLIKHHRELQQHWFYQTSEVFANHKQLRREQSRNGWPADQIAFTR